MCSGVPILIPPPPNHPHAIPLCPYSPCLIAPSPAPPAMQFPSSRSDCIAVKTLMDSGRPTRRLAQTDRLWRSGRPLKTLSGI